MVAHLYTRYLGDLSGGQILKKIAVNAMNLQDGEGTAFYEFEQIPDEKAFKNNYRQVMNDLPIEGAKLDEVVDEANAAFDMNMVMFNELEGNLIKAIGIQLFNLLTRKRSRNDGELATAE
jgi:heme oxygenase (biliverdin-producing, ferredoxin)